MAKLWPGFWVQFGMIGALYSLMGLWGIPHLRDVHGLSREFAADHMTVMLVCFTVGFLFFGWITDLTWTGTIENGIRIYSKTDYYHGFIAMLIFTLMALWAGFRIKETNCRNIYT
jgi:hypothetical protein